MNLKNCKEWI